MFYSTGISWSPCFTCGHETVLAMLQGPNTPAYFVKVAMPKLGVKVMTQQQATSNATFTFPYFPYQNVSVKQCVNYQPRQSKVKGSSPAAATGTDGERMVKKYCFIVQVTGGILALPVNISLN